MFHGAVLEPGVVAVYIHVDDFGALSDDAGVSDEAIDVIAVELNRIGFQEKYSTATRSRDTSDSVSAAGALSGCRCLTS